MPVTVDATPVQGSQQNAFRRFAWGVLAYNVLVVLWGGYVRASGSGAGCGSHWPLCNGVVVPPAHSIETIIEFTHRLTSGLSLVLVGGLSVWSLRAFSRGHRARQAAGWSIVFLLLEALLGAGLVLFRFVAKDASAGRAWYLSAHLVNTQLLLGMLAATAWWAGHSPRLQTGSRTSGAAPLAVSLGASISGAIAALGDTLYPATSVSAGVASELAGSAPVLLRLRMVHPVIAIAAGIYLIRGGGAVMALVLLQFAAGLLNWILLAPVWMQLVHLLIADLLWIALVIRHLQLRTMV